MPISPDTIQASLRSYVLPYLPDHGALENLNPDRDRTPGVPFFKESFELGGQSIVGNGLIQWDGILFLYIYGIEGTGRAAGQLADIVLAAVPPLKSIPLLAPAVSSDDLRINGSIGPSRRKVASDAAGFTVQLVSIPWYCKTLRAG